MCDEVKKIQDRYNEIINSEELEAILNDGIEKTRKQAREKYELMKERIGLGR